MADLVHQPTAARTPHERALPDRRRHLRYCVAILLPLVTSFVVAQMQTAQAEHRAHPGGIIGLVWNSVAGVASLIVSLWHFSLRIVGVSLGIGLGLGLAGHVYEALSDAREEEERAAGCGTAGKRKGRAVADATSSGVPSNLPKDAAKAPRGMADVNSYHYLMRSAGYAVDNGSLRAQMVRGAPAADARKANDAKRDFMRASSASAGDSDGIRRRQHPRQSVYNFDQGNTASVRMKCMWPNLPPSINEALAKLSEFVLRDYVSVWYSKLDGHVVYEDPALSCASGIARVDSSSDCVSGPRNSSAVDYRIPATIPAESAAARRGRTASSPSGRRRRDASPNKDYPRSFSEGVDAAASNSAPRALHPPASPSLVPTPPLPREPPPPQQQQRTMVLTTTGTQPSPFIDALYSCFSYLLGILATRAAENINVLELLLLHVPHVLAQNLKIYREMRNVALKKKQRRVLAEREKWSQKRRTQENHGETHGGGPFSVSFFDRSEACAPPGAGQEEEVSEIAVVREYLLAGRFHRAATFGLDVPSLLFADPLAKDTPPGPSYRGNSDIDRLNGHPDEDAILHDRLLSPEATLIEECELDYQRVLASKLARLTVPKTETDSSIVRTMLVEMLAACVLGPVMGCFHPDMINGWIIKGLGLLDVEGAATNGDSASDAGNTSVDTKVNGISKRNQPVGDSKKHVNPVSSNCSTTLGSEEDFSGGIVDGFIDDIASEGSVEGSVISDMETSSLFDMEDDSARKKMRAEPLGNCSKGEQIITMLSMSIIDLQNFVDFEDCRYAREHGHDFVVDWDAQNCRDSVVRLVLVIEAALLVGIRAHPRKQLHAEDRAFSTFEIEATLESPAGDVDEFEVDIDEGLVEAKVTSTVRHQHSSLSAVLMELTGDIDAFERIVEDAEKQSRNEDSLEDEIEGDVFIPKPHELATLRTLIAAWLHTGQICKVVSIIIRAKQTILRRYYHTYAFLRKENYVSDFTRLLRQLERVEILVDTMAVLSSQCLLQGISGKGDNGLEVFLKSLQSQPKSQKHDATLPETGGKRRPLSNANSNMSSMSLVGSVKSNLAQNRDRIARFAQSATEIDLMNPFKDRTPVQTRRPLNSPGANTAYNLYQNNHNTLPVYLTFSTNDVLASSLRSERERRSLSWLKEIKDMKKLDFVCRTKGIKDKDIMMHKELHHLSRLFYSSTSELRIEPCSIGDDESRPDSAANLTLKSVGLRRKIEVPDEDSSFLLRAHARPLKPVAIQRSNNAACKVYMAMYEEPAIHPRTKRFYGGRYLRQCLMRYYPNDRMASITASKKIDVLDCRYRGDKNKFVLTEDFQKLRYTCLKVATGGILSSPLMEPNDFCSTPRTGRAIDFAYRVPLFERPLVELGGKKFLVRDASSHRADASSLELSDAAMTAALILRGSCGLNICDSSQGAFKLQVSDGGTPLVLLRDGLSADTPSKKKEARPYRPSFIRAALLIKSAKQEAQSQCLLHCIRNGSAKTLSKVKSDKWLQPTLTLLHYANSRQQDEQSALLRDLRFGIDSIDRGQLIRDGLLNPRHPTVLRGLNTKMLGVIAVKTASDFDLLGGPLVLFKIRCTAIAEYVSEEEGDRLTANTGDESTGEHKKDRRARYFREEWTVLRSLRDFSLFHKHIKAQVAPTEHSASASAKLVGSVSAALTIVGGSTAANERQRGPLVPSLNQATKAGTLGLSTKKIWERRKKLLDQYLKYLVNPHNLLSRCPELLKFLGAYTHLPSSEGSDKVADAYGREDIRRVELVTEKLKVGIVEEVKQGTEEAPSPNIATKNPVEESMADSKTVSMDDNVTVSTLGGITVATQEEPKLIEKKPRSQTARNHLDDERRKLAKVRADEIRLKDVRRFIFRLLKYLFDLDNASFFRSRVISVLKTMSVAVTSVQDFHVLLVKIHVDYMNGEYISGWIVYLINMFWPNGVFYTKVPPLTKEEQFDLKQNSKRMIQKMFPDQLRLVLGRNTDEGLDMLHEMLQNRLVLKSIGYMLMDLVWSELFPELNDDYFFTGAECLEKED